MSRITVKVVGVSFKNPDGTSRQDLLCRLYDDYWTEGKEAEVVLALVREPENEHDPNAVAVFVQAPKRAKGQIGYLPRDHARVISSRMDMISAVRLHDMRCGPRAAVSLTIRLQVRALVRDREGRTYEF